jgi:hypothetical protein
MRKSARTEKRNSLRGAVRIAEPTNLNRHTPGIARDDVKRKMSQTATNAEKLALFRYWVRVKGERVIRDVRESRAQLAEKAKPSPWPSA